MILPWRVDVPQERRPVMNWLIILAAFGVFILQVREAMYAAPAAHDVLVSEQAVDANEAGDDEQVTEQEPAEPESSIRGFVLDGWSLKGLFGHMWLHAGILHLIGNMWFLWVFGNAVCAKIGNGRYLGLYLFLGVAAGAAHLIFSSGSVVGASGAINGVVGMYLAFFPENDITCYWSPIIIYWRQFTVSSFWMVLFWLFWDIVGVTFLGDSSEVAYFAHLGGFAAGFGIAVAMCHYGWVTMERYERSLVQMWQDWRGKGRKTSPMTTVDHMASWAGQPAPAAEPVPIEPPRQVPFLSLDEPQVSQAQRGLGGGFACACGCALPVSREYAGKLVRCPACQEKVQIPPLEEAPQPTTRTRPPADERPIRFTCACGQAIKVPARYAGRMGKCPRCKECVRIPRRS